VNDLPRGFWNRLLTGWVLGVARFALPVVLLAGVGTYFSFQYVVHHLHISTDREKMLSDSLDFREDFDREQAEFPQYKNNLVLVIDAETPELARDTAVAVAGKLRGDPELFPYVYLPRADPFLEKHALYYLGAGDAQDLADRLTQIQPFLGRLTRDPTLRGLFDMLDSALEAKMDGTEVELGPVFERMAPAIDGVLAGRPHPMSWQELMQDKEPTPDERRQFVITRPATDSDAMFPATPALEGVRRIVAELGLDGRSDVDLRITGGLALNHEELSSVAQGAEWIGILVLLLVATFLVLGLRSLRLVLTTLAVLLAGMIFTAFFATAAVGHLNLISVAFAALYIGLGVDYAIHFCLRYQELVRQGKTHTFALQCTASDVGISLFVCAATTALAFYSFVPTSYSGVSELGLISGTGMFISLFVTLTLLPALLTLFPRSPSRHPKPVRPGFFSRKVLPFPVHHRKIVLGSTAFLTVGALALLPRVRFDANPMHLKDPSGEAVQTYLDLLRTSDTPPWQITVLRPDEASARAIADRLEALDVVDKTVTLSDFVPDDQAERLALLEDLSLVLGPELGEKGDAAPPAPAEETAAMRAFSTRLDAWLAAPAGRADAPARALRAALGRLLAADARGAGTDPDPRLGTLQSVLLDTLPENLERLKASLEAEPFGRGDLPARLVERWLSQDGTWRVEAFPKQKLDNTKAVRVFAEAVQKVAPHSTGNPVITVKSGKAVVDAFQEAFLLALLATTLILTLVLRNLHNVVLVLVPLVLAGIFTGAATVLFGVPFNFANVIALPLLLGIGVDNGIHMVHRARHGREIEINPLHTSTSRGVVYSALTTASSFGNLALSPHRGTASMGLLLTIGIALNLFCTLVVLPGLLHRVRPPKSAG